MENTNFIDTLKKRTFSSVFIIILVALVFWLNSWVLKIFSAALIAIMSYEWVRLCQIKRQKIIYFLVPLMWVAFYLASIGRYKMGIGVVLLFASLGILLSWFAWHRRFLWGGIALIYIGLPIVSLHAMLYKVDNALSILIWTITVVAGNDIGGYLFGNLLKGPKFLPEISPKKTWSGFAGGIFSSVLLGVLAHYLLTCSFPPSYFYVAIISMALLAVMGDLFESFVKRKHRVKDAGNLIPGHGGILDRLDGLLFVLPLIAWICFHSPAMFDRFPNSYKDWKKACQYGASTLVSNE
jgi:phosphatidate cytidylyltransferase